MRALSIRGIHFLSELVSDAAAIGFLFLAFALASRSVEAVFAMEAVKGADTIDRFIGRFLQDQDNAFDALIIVPDKVSGAAVLREFVDVYLVDDSLSVKTVYKKSGSSAIFRGLSFAGSGIGSYFTSVKSGEHSRSAVVRAFEDDQLSVYISHRTADGLYVGRLNLGSLSKDMANMAESLHLLYYFATNEGIVYATSDPEKRFAILPEQPSRGWLEWGDYLYASVRSSFLGDRIAVLYPRSTWHKVMSGLGFASIILLSGLILFSVLKYLSGYLFIVKPLRGFVSTISSWNILDGPGVSPGSIFIPEDIVVLSNEFNKAKSRILQAYAAEEGAKSELAALNQSLEKRVAERTRDLEAANDELGRKNGELADALAKLRKTGDILVAQGKMAALGELSAGVAHELNTPLGTMISSVSFAEATMPEAYSASGRFAKTLDQEGTALLSDLYRSAFDARESMARTSKEVLKVLEDMCAARAWKTPRVSGERMAETGLAPGDVLVERALKHPRGEEAVSCAWNYGSVLRGLAIARSATEKAVRVVGALRSFSWDTGDESARINLKENLEIVMVLLENRMKRGVAVKTEMDDTVHVMGNADRLNQVWINLVSNALHAMNDNGRLWIRVSRREGNALVEIMDSGTGIPWEIRDRIFEPFFTTKPRGEGTGLGLDISRHIVEAMDGELWFESVPGRTVFYTRLPLAPEDGQAKGS